MPTIPILADNTSAPNVAYWLAVILVAAGLGLIVLVLLGMRRGFGPLQVQVENMSNGGLEASGVGTTQEAERLLRLMGEAEEVCTRLGRDLDDKALRLERLLARADGMLGDSAVPSRPASGMSNVGNQPPQDGMYSPPSAPAYPSRPEIVTRPVGVPAPAQPVGYAAPSYPQQRMAQQAQPSPAQALFGPQAAYQQPAPNDPEAVAQQIYRLTDAGLTPAEIAQRLGQHTGKVELIIALRNT